MTRRLHRLLPRKTVLGTHLLGAALVLPAAASLLVPSAFAQTTGGTLSGTVTDSTGAIIPGATVVLRNANSGDTRTIKSNGSGVFTFAGVPSGDYVVKITSPGFQQFSESGVHLDPGDNRTLPQLALQTGDVTQSVTVEAQSDVPLDTGEVSDLITSEQIKHLSVEGRDVTELFKTLPGFAISNGNGGVGNSAYDPSQVNVSGALGSYAANGNPVDGISLRLDGANITDPGNFGAAIQNVNYDQVAEVKVQVSNFGADIANGPVVVSAVTKAGGDHFHGELYTYARTNQLDSTDALDKAVGNSKDPDREVYPGFNIGGPVIIPGTNFNHSRKLTFFAGVEDYAQRNIYAYGGASGALVHALVPTQNMRNGNYSATELQNYLGGLYYAPPSDNLPPGSLNPAETDLNTVPSFLKDGTPVVNGQIPSSYADPGFAAIFATYPLPNRVATIDNPYNWQSQDLVNDDLWQAIGRVDLAISDKNHLFGRYSVERGVSGEPTAVYYNPGGLNTPGGGINKINSESAAANLTTIFSASLTNQVFGALAYLDSAYTSPNPGALTAYPYQGAFNNGRHALPELQGYGNSADGLPLSLTPDYSLKPIFAHKFDPEGGDTVTKVWGTHTAEFGVYITRVTNNEVTPNTATNGALTDYYLPGAGLTLTDVNGSSAVMSGNYIANNFEGYTGGYSQNNILPDSNLYFWNNDFFAQDSWKMLKNLTVNYGARFEHLGLWNDAYGKGVAVFNPALIASGASNSPYPGFLWHALDKSIPLSGNASAKLYVEPRVGFAWDAKGNGSTVIRGGWGEYRSHDSWNDTAPAVTVSQGSQSVNYSGVSLKAISGLNLSDAPNVGTGTNTYGVPTPCAPGTLNVNCSLGSGAGGLYALTPGDRQQPLTDTYSLTINQQLPWKMNALVGYVGNNSRFLLDDGSNESIALDNVNAIPIGGLYKPNPLSSSPCFGQVLTPTGVTPVGGTCSVTSGGATAAQIDQYRPLNTNLVQYGTLNIPKHNLSANYNGLQFGLARQTGRVLFNVNYTFSKALGILGGYGNGLPGNPFNMSDDYGPETFDRTHIFNASYTFELGKPFQNKFVGAFTNGWEISGITNLQSGTNIPTTTTNPGFSVNGTIGPANEAGTGVNGVPAVANPNQIAITNTVYLGTPDVSLQPTLTCNPKSGTGGRNYINGNCFGLPNLLQNGPYQYPYLKGPFFFDTDLSAQKAFTIHREQNIVFRLSAFNFINHANPTFTGDFAGQYQLNLTNPTGTSFNQAKLNPTNFGTALYETGRRVLELSAKYNF